MTPAFAGGASQAACEIRPPAIKGLLRFWFRFLAGAWYDGDATRVAAHEAHLFGHADHGVGACAVRLGNMPTFRRPTAVDAYREWPAGLGYLGLGPVDRRAFTGAEKDMRRAKRLSVTAYEPKRPFFDVGTEIAFDLLFRRATLADIDAVRNALRAWALFGGNGSRSRRGWGSFSILEPSDLGIGKLRAGHGAAAQIRGIVKELCRKHSPAGASFTHWFERADVVTPPVTGNWTAAMDWLGQQLAKHRSNVTPGGLYWDDHEELRNFLQIPTYTPRGDVRASFGLPHNYFFGSLKRAGANPHKASVTATLNGHLIERRASPLFVKVREGARNAAVTLLYVPSDLLPPGATLQFDPEYVRGPRTMPRSASTATPPSFAAVSAFVKKMRAVV